MEPNDKTPFSSGTRYRDQLNVPIKFICGLNHIPFDNDEK